MLTQDGAEAINFSLYIVTCVGLLVYGYWRWRREP
jgi:hypothetical protein